MDNLTEAQFDKICAKLQTMRANLNYFDGKYLFCADQKESGKLTAKFHDYMIAWIKELGADPKEFERVFNQNPESRFQEHR